MIPPFLRVTLHDNRAALIGILSIESICEAPPEVQKTGVKTRIVLLPRHGMVSVYDVLQQLEDIDTQLVLLRTGAAR